MTMRSISLLSTWILASCAASTTSQSTKTGDDQSLSALMEENASKDAEEFAEYEQCRDESNEVRNCERDSECCEGFTCGWDPQVSHVMKVCIYAGSEATLVAADSE